jgi:undecaprenyl-diphosphatase
MTGINISLFKVINSFAGRSVFFDKLMVFCANHLIYIVPLFLLFIWFKKSEKDSGKKKGLFIFVSVMVSLFFGWIITKFYYHPRPFAIGLGKDLIVHTPDSSFPSDHATVMFATSFALFFLRENVWGFIFFILSLVVGFARVFCGIHFPLDILGAIPVSLLGAIVVFIFRSKAEVLFSGIISIYYKFLRLFARSK